MLIFLSQSGSLPYSLVLGAIKPVTAGSVAPEYLPFSLPSYRSAVPNKSSQEGCLQREVRNSNKMNKSCCRAQYKRFPYRDSGEEFGLAIDRNHSYHPGWKALSEAAATIVPLFCCCTRVFMEYSTERGVSILSDFSDSQSGVWLTDVIDPARCTSICAAAVTDFHSLISPSRHWLKWVFFPFH